MTTKLHIIMYHYVRDLQDSRYPEIKGLDYKEFIEQIRFLKQNFNIIGMEEVLLAKNYDIDLPENAVLLTFDDGYSDHFSVVFPVLVNENIQGSFFVPGKILDEKKMLDVNKIHFILATTDINIILKHLLQQIDTYRGKEFDYTSNDELLAQYAIANRFDTKEVIFIKRMLQTILPEPLRNIIIDDLFQSFVPVPEKVLVQELYMNKDQLRCMKSSGMHIGVHGYEHYWLGHQSRESIQTDITKSLETLGDLVDKNNWVMNYPYGSFNSDVIDCIKEMGCAFGLTTQVGIADIKNDKPYVIPRMDTNDFPPKSDNYKDMGVFNQ